MFVLTDESWISWVDEFFQEGLARLEEYLAKCLAMYDYGGPI